MYEPEIRMKWDPNVKNFRKFNNGEFGLKLNEDCYLVHTQYNSPFKMFMSERESLVKRMEFMNDGKLYDFSSSIEETVTLFYYLNLEHP
jgi:hypothetical protein